MARRAIRQQDMLARRQQAAAAARPTEVLDDTLARQYVRDLQGGGEGHTRGVLLALADACRPDNASAKANRACLSAAGGVAQLVEMLVDESAVGRLGPKGADAHAFTRHVVWVLRDLAAQGANDDDSAAVHAQMIFVGLPAWLVGYLRAAAEAKRASSGIVSGMAGRIARPALGWSGGARFEPTTTALSQQLVLMLAASASGMEGLLHAGLAQALAEEIGAAPPELASAVFAAAMMALKYHHECTGGMPGSGGLGDPGYSKLVANAGVAVQNEVAVLVEDLKLGEIESVYMVAAEELVRRDFNRRILISC